MDSENAIRNRNAGVNGNKELLAGGSALLGGELNVLHSVGVINGNVHNNMTYKDPSGRATAAPSSEDQGDYCTTMNRDIKNGALLGIKLFFVKISSG